MTGLRPQLASVAPLWARYSMRPEIPRSESHCELWHRHEWEAEVLPVGLVDGKWRRDIAGVHTRRRLPRQRPKQVHLVVSVRADGHVEVVAYSAEGPAQRASRIEDEIAVSENPIVED